MNDTIQPQESLKTHDIWQQVNPDAAGADIGNEEIWLAVPEGRCEQPVRKFATYTVDMEAAVAWLIECGVKTVAMEATGIYWFTFHDLLEEAGLEVYVVNGRHVKNVSGRKSDILDCQWLQQLHSYGLLNSSFHPEGPIREMRAVMRQRQRMVQYRSQHIQHMHKALQMMNIKLPMVLSDITGVTGLKIIRAIIAGETDPETLTSFRHPNCKYGPDDFVKALTGHYIPALIFNLQQALTMYEHYGQQLAEFDDFLEKMYQKLETADTENPPPPASPKSRRKNQLHFNARGELFRVCGVDLVAVEGLDTLTVQTIFTELGTDVSKWPTVKHFASWLGLAPNNQVTGGRVKSRKTRKSTNPVTVALRLAAQTLARSQSYLGHYYRRMRAKQGPQKAITSTAHKLARIIYFMLLRKTPYMPPDVEQVEQARRQKAVARLKKQARRLGYELNELDFIA